MKIKMISAVMFCSLLALAACRGKAVDPDINYTSLIEDSLIVLKTGDSAVIYFSYPKGTVYYDYEFSDAASRVVVLRNTADRGDDDEAGGSMSERYYIKAITPGLDTIRFIDQSPPAVRLAADSAKAYKNYLSFPVEIRDLR